MKVRQRIIIPPFLVPAIFAVILIAGSSAQDGLAYSEGHPSPDKDILKGIDLLYNWRFDEAESIFQEYVEEHPDDPLGYFYKAMVTWSRLASGFWSPETVREYEKRVDQTVSIAEIKIEKDEADSLTYFYMGGALGFKGRLQLMEHKWLQSFKLALSAVKALEKCRELDPDNREVLLGLGIYDYYTARLSGVFKFMTYLFIRKGDREEGLRKLSLAANEAAYAAVEAKSILLHIYLFMESRYDQALPLARELARRFANNPRYGYLLGLTYLRLNRQDDYLLLLRRICAHGDPDKDGTPSLIWRHWGLYLAACKDMLSKRYDEGREKLEIILQEVNKTLDPSMAAFPLLKIGMSYDLEGKRDKAVEYYNKILVMYNGAGAQFLAEKYIEERAETDDPFLGY